MLMNIGHPAVEQGEKPVTVIGLCGIEPMRDTVRINRKFHTGMVEYTRRLRNPVVCILPRQARADLDVIEVPRNELPYGVYPVESRNVNSGDMPILDRTIRNSAVVYCGPAENLNHRVASLCLRHHVPYIVVTEFTLRTECDILYASTSSRPRRWWRELKLQYAHRKERWLVAHAKEVHANGYPTFVEYARTNPDRILFFDSRVSSSDVVAAEAMDKRLAGLRQGKREPRLIYSGRYHPMKGVLNVIKAGIELRRRRIEFRLDLFGSGDLKSRMVELVRSARAEPYIFVNDPVPFSPDLLEITRQCDVFLCCHVQGDPSCTYLETFAGGVPIVGYANEMWSPLCRESGGGILVETRDPADLAQAVVRLLSNFDQLRTLSVNARNFAARHTMEDEWEIRCRRLQMAATPAL
jgi:colanic acid/amylovoran biosynthesis glycosyltransferase